MWFVVALPVLVVLVAFLVALSPRGQERERQRELCTKHVVRTSAIPGGPDELVWSYGPHKTPGNECDGTDHARVPGTW